MQKSAFETHFFLKVTKSEGVGQGGFVRVGGRGRKKRAANGRPYWLLRGFLNAGVFVALIRQGCAVPPIHYCAIATGNC